MRINEEKIITEALFVLNKFVFRDIRNTRRSMAKFGVFVTSIDTPRPLGIPAEIIEIAIVRWII